MLLRTTAFVTFIFLLLLTSLASAGGARPLATASLAVSLQVLAHIEVQAPPNVVLRDGKGELDALVLSNANWTFSLSTGSPVKCRINYGDWEQVDYSGSTITRAFGYGRFPIHIEFKDGPRGNIPLRVYLVGTLQG